MTPPTPPIDLNYQRARLKETRRVIARESVISWFLIGCSFLAAVWMLASPGLMCAILIAGFVFTAHSSRRRVGFLRQEERHIKRLIERREDELWGDHIDWIKPKMPD